MRRRESIFIYIKRIKRSIFTTSELVSISGKSPSSVSQGLRFLEKKGIVEQVYRGVWIDAQSKINIYMLIPSLFPLARVYVSFLSALHLYGVIEQIPQVVMLASVSHTRKINTKIGTFHIYRLSPKFFCGFKWYKNKNFLIAEREKALIDCLYLSFYKSKQFRYFPELNLSEDFDIKKAEEWIGKIPYDRIRIYVRRRLKDLLEKYR